MEDTRLANIEKHIARLNDETGEVRERLARLEARFEALKARFETEMEWQKKMLWAIFATIVGTALAVWLFR